jgi:antirestriction protein ArdC
MMKNHKQSSVFDRVTDIIIADLTRGVLPWQKPWGEGRLGCPIRPCRHNGAPYNGVNVLLLWGEAQAKGYQLPMWMTYKKAALLGAQVRHGEKSSFVVYANKVSKIAADSTTGQELERQIPFMRGYSVFNVAQIDGLPEQYLLSPPLPTAQPGRLENAGYFMRNTGAVVRHGGDAAYYAEQHDHIQLPYSNSFKDAESYYATLAHEVIHWTKHDTRLKRDFGRVVWGDAGYAKEELVAEIGAAFLCADLGITPDTRPDHAAYIAHWLKKCSARHFFSQ